MSDDKPQPKIGAGHASAMFRLGLAELRAAVAFSESNIIQPSPYGIYGTKTPGEVQEERQSSSQDRGDYPPPALSERRLESGEERGRDEPDPEPPPVGRE
jgi:hypothetical protein